MENYEYKNKKARLDPMYHRKTITKLFCKNKLINFILKVTDYKYNLNLDFEFHQELFPACV